MTNREREQATLNFGQLEGRGSVEETFYPWDLTVSRFYEEGLPEALWKGLVQQEEEACEKYFKVSFGKPVLDYESYLGFDPVRRAKFLLPHGGDSPVYGFHPKANGKQSGRMSKKRWHAGLQTKISKKYMAASVKAMKKETAPYV